MEMESEYSMEVAVESMGIPWKFQRREWFSKCTYLSDVGLRV